MHLSLLSDNFVSDRLADSGRPIGGMTSASLGRAHLQGVIRGLIFMAAIAVPFGLAFASGHDRQDGPAAPAILSTR